MCEGRRTRWCALAYNLPAATHTYATHTYAGSCGSVLHALTCGERKAAATVAASAGPPTAHPSGATAAKIRCRSQHASSRVRVAAASPAAGWTEGGKPTAAILPAARCSTDSEKTLTLSESSSPPPTRWNT